MYKRQEFNEALAKRHTEEAGAAIDWLDEELGVDFGDRSLVGGAYTAMQTLRVTRALGSYSMGAANAYLDPLNERLEQAIADGKDVYKRQISAMPRGKSPPSSACG